jgi:hypothetical protein
MHMDVPVPQRAWMTESGLSLRHLTKSRSSILFAVLKYAPVAQLDRVPGYEPGGREFESLRARHIPKEFDVVQNLLLNISKEHSYIPHSFIHKRIN